MFNSMRDDLVYLEPMMMGVADMVPDNAGTRVFHCYVNEQIEGGIRALFTVKP